MRKTKLAKKGNTILKINYKPMYSFESWAGRSFE
jgi:hypothetical protein